MILFILNIEIDRDSEATLWVLGVSIECGKFSYA